MNIAVCEDRASDCNLICDYIRRYCEENCFLCQLHPFASGEELLADFSPGRFDVIFLDIYMGGISGMDAARAIRENDPDCALVFITVSEEHLRQSFSVQVTSYVVKPIRPEEMAAAFTACRRVFLENARYIEVKSDYKDVKIPLLHIHYVEVRDKAAYFHTSRGPIKTYLTIEEVERMLPPVPFLRCHRAFIINMNHISDVETGDFLMRDGQRVPIRKNGGRALRAAVAQYSASRLFEAQGI